ncbi:hypothetical protein GCM10007203_07030 [Staphylococcus nepalensis]|nr:hypothetical protein GCM10007203_07030 [Staphylococcus nepalensis]
MYLNYPDFKLSYPPKEITRYFNALTHTIFRDTIIRVVSGSYI